MPAEEAAAAAAKEAAPAPPSAATTSGGGEALPLPRIKRLRVCLLGATPEGSSFQPGVGKADVASALLRGLTADRPGEADPILDLAFDYGVFERAWWELLKEVPEDAPIIDRWGIGPLSVWDTENRLRYDRRGPGEATPPYDHEPDEDCASLCAGSSEKLNFGHKASPGVLRAFREALQPCGQDLAAMEGVQQALVEEAEKRPRELVRKDRPCPGLVASFARHSPEVGDLKGCGCVFLHVFEEESRPAGSSRNVAMLYAAAPTSRLHRGQTPGTFLLALWGLGSNIARLVREYNRAAGGQAAPEAWERAMWWQTDLKAQVEYLLSDKTLRQERYFREKIVGQEEGWISMDIVKGCQRMVHSGVTANEELVDALKDSKVVEAKVGEDGQGQVRRAGGRLLPNLEEPRKRRYGGGEVTWAKRARNANSDDPTCWDFVRRGVCPRGDKCKYLHSQEGEGAGGAAPAVVPPSAEGEAAAQPADSPGADANAPSATAVAAASAEGATAAVPAGGDGAAPATVTAAPATAAAAAPAETATKTPETEAKT